MKRPVVLVLLAALLPLGCGRAGEGEPPARAVRVRTGTASRRDVAVRLRVSGRIAPPEERQASVAPAVAGRIVEVSAREGARVVEGEILARVDPRPLDDGLRSAEASLARAKADASFRREAARRSRELFEKGVASRQEAEADEAAAVASEASVVEATTSVANARRGRGFADVAAPFDGVVLKVLRHAGEQVDGSPATPVVEVAGLHPLEVALDVPPEALARLKAGDPAEVTLPSGARSAALVRRVAGALDAASVVGGVRLRFEGGDPPLALGSPVEVSLVLEQLKDVVAVPRRAVRRGPQGGTEVVLVVDGKAHAAPVTTGPEEGDWVVVREGLKGGEVLVVEDPLGLPDGTALEAGR